MRITASLILSLITNLIVMMGATSFFYWLQSSTATPFVIRHRKFFELGASVTFMTFLFCQAMANTYLDQMMYGFHWTFLNLLIVTMFMLNLQVVSKWQVIIDAVLTLAYLVLFSTPLRVLGLVSWAVGIASLGIVQAYTPQLRQKRCFEYGLLVVFAAAMLTMVYQMQPEHLDVWFWVRQLSALVIIGVFCVEFDQVMRGTQNRTDNIETRANRDELTGLLNFGAFNRALTDHFTAFKAGTGSAYVVFEYDLDWFKRVNDTYGHLAGNKVLHKLAQEIQRHAQSTVEPATVYRLGGEEFAMIVESPLKRDQALQLAQLLQARLQQVRFNDIDPALRITCSIGEACVKASDYSDNDVYKAADRNLYHAKQSGRDAVVLANDEL
ncbi:GGDEF domain-containing protein [Lacticaseibacillus sp. GG6-2]